MLFLILLVIASCADARETDNFKMLHGGGGGAGEGGWRVFWSTYRDSCNVWTFEQEVRGTDAWLPFSFCNACGYSFSVFWASRQDSLVGEWRSPVLLDDEEERSVPPTRRQEATRRASWCGGSAITWDRDWGKAVNNAVD